MSESMTERLARLRVKDEAFLRRLESRRLEELKVLLKKFKAAQARQKRAKKKVANDE
jgi:hypothetical protein